MGNEITVAVQQSTLYKLQAHLATPIKSIGGYSQKDQAGVLLCADGTTMSVQASQFHYCSPRSDVGPYTSVEIWRIKSTSQEVTQFEYDPDEPSGYVPIEQVAAFIDACGGYAGQVVSTNL